jgi:hypothetical protein
MKQAPLFPEFRFGVKSETQKTLNRNGQVFSEYQGLKGWKDPKYHTALEMGLLE